MCRYGCQIMGISVPNACYIRRKPPQTTLCLLRNLDRHLTKVLLVKHVLVRLLELRQAEDLLVDNRVDVISLNRSIHVLELLARAYKQTAYSAKVVEAVKEGRLVLGEAANETDYA